MGTPSLGGGGATGVTLAETKVLIPALCSTLKAESDAMVQRHLVLTEKSAGRSRFRCLDHSLGVLVRPHPGGRRTSSLTWCRGRY